MSNDLFRKKTLDRIKEPEKLNSYIQAPKVHPLLAAAAVIFLVAGFIAWRIGLGM